MQSLHELGAAQARRLIASGEISPVDLVEACIARIESVDPALNAMVAKCYERAREEARAAEQAARRGAPLGALHGLPVGIKDLNDTEGLRTTRGSLLYEDHVPSADDRIVASLRRAGAIVLGKTNTPEFGAGAHTVNRVYGATRNPFDTNLTCGGSSGGSAVALASDMVPLCTGSDTGGSLRTPASFCGVVSIRATPGVVPSDRRAIGLSTFGVQGPMARSVADASLMLSAMAGPDRSDPLSGPLDAAAFAGVDEVDLAQLRVATSEDLGFAPMDDGVRAVFRERVRAIAPWFAECRARDPEMAQASRAFWLVRGAHFLAADLDCYRENRALLGPNVIDNVEAGLSMRPEDIAWASAEQTRIYRKFQDFFGDFDLLICPSAAVPPFPIEQRYCTHVNGAALATYIQWVDICSGITLTGHPVVQLPCGRGPTGLPFGLQIVGPALHSERFLIGVAAALERRFADTPGLARPRPGAPASIADQHS